MKQTETKKKKTMLKELLTSAQKTFLHMHIRADVTKPLDRRILLRDTNIRHFKFMYIFLSTTSCNTMMHAFHT